MTWYADHYRRPDLEAVAAAARQHAAACARAEDAGAFLAELERWNAQRATVATQRELAMVAYHRDTTEDRARAEQDFWDGAAPTLRELDVLHADAVLDARHRAAVTGRWGEQLLALKRCTRTTFVPAIGDDLAAEARLVTRYNELLSRPEIVFRSGRYSIETLNIFFDDADRATRLEAQQARDGFLAAHGDELDELYGQLVALRDRMGRALGHASFTPLGYQLMTRSSYGPDQVAVFRDAIRERFVPLASHIRAQQARRLGVDRLLFHDEPVLDPAGNPRPIGDGPATLAAARRMYHELGPAFGEFIDVMLDRELIDWEPRPGKAGGGFCTTFFDLRVPFIFATFTGSTHDVTVMTHECGHAFQAWASRELDPMEYGFPNYEAAEVHSMGMEYLTFPWMELFFGARADSFRRHHVEELVLMLPYMAAIDEFQHRVYAEPTMTAAQRRETWLAMEATYQPHREYGGLLPHMASGGYWQRQRHIYMMPFYYIDYALAGVCALQIWMRAARDRERTMADYLAMCRIGGSLSFEEMLEVGGLRSPFDPDCLAEVAAHVAAELG